MRRPIIDKRMAICLGGAWILILVFDVVWSAGTTFRGMSAVQTWLNSLLLALLVSLPYVLTRRVWVQGGMMVVTGLLLEANLMYCRTYNAAIPADNYLFASNLTDFRASVADALRWPDLGLAAVIVATVWMAYSVPKVRGRLRLTGYMAGTVCVGVVCWLVTLPYGGMRRHIETLTESCYYLTTPPVLYTIPGVILAGCNSSDGEELTSEIREEIENWMKEKERQRPFISLADSTLRRKNLVVILCESLESWPIGSKIGGIELTPNLNRLVEDTTSFYAARMLTQVAAGRSIDAQLLLSAGMLPMEKSVYAMRYPERTYPSLVKAMRGKGMERSYIVTADKPTTWNQSRVAAAFGVDTLLTSGDWRRGEMIGNPAKLSDRELVRQSIEKMRSGEIWPEGEHAFVEWVTYSGHNPFRLPEELRDKELDGVIPSSWPGRLADYVRMVHYTDGAIGELVDYLRSRSDADSTLILITGDHEGLGNDRGAMHKSSGGLVDNGGYTPFLLVNSPVAGRMDAEMGQIDMYPTLLSLLGLEDYGWKGMGENILAERRVPIAISSLTMEMVGDTAHVPSAGIENVVKARHISDIMIRTDALKGIF